MENKKGLENTCKLYGQASAKKLDKGYRIYNKNVCTVQSTTGTGWPEQEWVLLQLTKINGVGEQNCSKYLWKKSGYC
jgi:hypothetical protein